MKAPLTPEERALRARILRRWADTGRPPMPEELTKAFDLPQDRADTLLEALEQKDYIRLEERTRGVVLAYPFSAQPTPHEITLIEGQRIFAVCAIDALGASEILQQDFAISSPCPFCHTQIMLEIQNKKIASARPETVVILDTLPQRLYERSKGSALAETCCLSTNFFCSPEHAKAWKVEHGGVGKVLHLDEAFVRARLLFDRCLEKKKPCSNL